MSGKSPGGINISAHDYIASALRLGFSREALLCALDELAPPHDHYLVPVDYAPIPAIAELEKEFSVRGVSPIFDGRPWLKHASCAEMNETPGERVMFLKRFGKLVTNEEAIAAGMKNGYRPATHHEALAFARAHPALQQQFWIVAPGSFAVKGGDCRFVTVLDCHDGRRVLDDGWYETGWSAGGRFLFVRTSCWKTLYL